MASSQVSPIIHLLLSVCKAKKGEDNQRLLPSHWDVVDAGYEWQLFKVLSV